MTIAQAIEYAKARLVDYAAQNPNLLSGRDVTLLLWGLSAARDHNATLFGQLERMIDRYNAQAKRIEELEASNRALAMVAGLRALKRAS